MSASEFWAGLRRAFLDIRDHERTPVWAVVDDSGRCELLADSQRTAQRLGGLVAQIAMAAGAAHEVEAAHDAGLLLLAEFCKGNASPNLSEQVDLSASDPGSCARPSCTTMIVDDLCLVAADYCEIMTSRATAQAMAPEAPPPPEQPLVGPGVTARNVFRQVGGAWEFAFDGQLVREARNYAGFDLIRRLLRRPATAIPAFELLDRHVVGGHDPILDDRAVREYEAALRDLKDRLEIASDLGQVGEEQAIQEEILDVQAHLVQATGLGGRPRGLKGEVERARLAATKNFTVAVRRLDDVLPDMARHLRASVKRGADFAYGPPTPTDWVTE